MADKWWDISDDDLDNVFKDAAEENIPAFDGAAWNKMQEKLDGSSKNRKPMGYKTWWWSAGLLLLLITGITYFKFDNQSFNQKEKNPSTVQASKQNENSNEINQGGTESATSKTNKPLAENAKSGSKEQTMLKTDEPLSSVENKNSEPIVTKLDSKETIAKKPIAKTNVAQKTTVLKEANNEGSISTKTKELNDKKETLVAKAKISQRPVANPNRTSKDKTVSDPNKILTENDKTYSVKNQAANTSEEVATENTSPTNTADNFTKNTTLAREKKQRQLSKVKRNSEQEVESLPIPVTIEAPVLPNVEKIASQTVLTQEAIQRPIIEANSLTIKEIHYNTIALKSETPDLFAEPLFVLDNQAPQKTRIERPKHGIQFTFAPDFNSVEKLSPNAFGGSLGILYDYEFAHRFRVQLGGIYTVKKYNAAIETYHAWGNAKWAANPVTDIDADCRILDIPINIRYDAWRAPKYDVFVSTGLSSYLMLFEHYNYYYQNSNPWPKVIDQYRAGDYYLSSFNFSVGYDRQIGKNFTIQIEPYMKFAMKQAGLGKVNFYSTGVLFSIKHQFGGRLKLNK